MLKADENLPGLDKVLVHFVCLRTFTSFVQLNKCLYSSKQGFQKYVWYLAPKLGYHISTSIENFQATLSPVRDKKYLTFSI